MRSAGVVSFDVGVVDRFVDALGGGVCVRRGGGVGGPLWAVGFRDDVYPGVSFAVGEDGSFCVVDGAVYGLGGVADRGSAAASLLGSGDVVGDLRVVDTAAMVVRWDAVSESCVVARDALGAGAAFVGVFDDAFYWASSVSVLRRLTPRSGVDLVALDFYISSGFVPAPWTLTEGHRRLGAGELARWSSSGVGIERYFEYATEWVESDGEVRLDLLRTYLPRSLRRRVRDPERTGVLLSSGVDSALLLALTRRELGVTPRSFTFRYSDYTGRLNEHESAADVASALQSEHTVLTVKPEEVVASLPRLLDVFGEPFTHGLHSVMLGSIAESGFTDLLSGAGADALYLEGQGHNAMRYGRLPALGRGALDAVARMVRPLDGAWMRRTGGKSLPLIGKAAASVRGGIWSYRTSIGYMAGDYLLRHPMRRGLYRDGTVTDRSREARREMSERELGYLGDRPLDTRIWLNGHRHFLADAGYSWNLNAGRSHGLAIHAPYASPELFASWSTHRSNERNKPAVRQFAAELLPDDLDTSAKLPQGVPIREWICGPLRDWVRDVLHPTSLDKWGVFDPDAVNKLVDAQMAGRNDLHWAIWNIAAATLWWDGIVERQ